MTVDCRYISLGAGVQSSAMLLMADDGMIGPKPDLAIFADTQAEPHWVYQQLDELEQRTSIPIVRATAGSLEEDCLRSRDGSRWASIPFFTPAPGTAQLNWITGDIDQKEGRLRRHCTREYKIDVVKRAVREHLGLAKGERAAGKYVCEEWVGISTDEATRAKPSRYSWIRTRWPLLEQEMNRAACLAWIRERGYPVPRKSSCYFCPFHDDAFWHAMRRDEPEVFEKACAFDDEMRKGKLRGVEAAVFLHRSIKPLREVEFDPDDDQDQFDNECEGMCGV